MTRHLIMGTAGHVDHGKTALIKALTNIDCDTHKEEKDRGITINLGFSHLDLPSGNSIGIVDVPGHKDFIRTMVAGAFGIDLVLLVVSADSGVMPQTIEHLNIIRMLGIEHGIVALSKIDLVDEDMVELAQLEIMELLEKHGLKDISVIGVSSVTGAGLNDLVESIENIAALIPEKEKSGFFRMYIDRIFNVKGIGSIVTGSVLNGDAKIGDELFLLPGHNKKVKIKNIERHGSQVEKVIAGDRSALNLSGLKLQDYKRGMILSDKQVEEVSMIDATLSLFDTGASLGLWSTVIFLAGTSESLAKIHIIDKEQIKEDETAIVQIHLEKPFILANQDKFIIRNSSNDLTLGGGVVFDIDPKHHKRRTESLINQLKTVVAASVDSSRLIDLIKLELDKLNKPVLLNDLAEKIQKKDNETLEACQNHQDDIVIYDLAENTIIVRRTIEKSYYDKVINEIREWHQKNPIDELGLDPKVFAGKMGLISYETGKLYLEQLILKINNDGLIKKVGNTWALKDHSVKIDPKTKEQLDWVEQQFRNYGKTKPMIEEIEQDALSQKINKERLKMMLRYLEKNHRLVFFEGEYLHKDIIDRSRDLLLKDLVHKEKGINEKEFRELIDTTKKMSQVLLGIFIKEGIVNKRMFFIDITEKGKTLISN